MKISTKDWLNYIKKMSKLSDIAGNKMQEYVQKNGFADRDALIDYAHALVTKYGEGSAELACQMYDLIAEMENTSVPSAYPAATATYQETAKAINGSLKQSPGGNLIDSVAQRLVKQASADTMLKNAKRDGAYFAWIPHGDTCPYCLMMGGIGWQKAGKSTLNGNHANHIHAHCDCQYVVDFKGDLQVSDYDPDKLQNELLEASGYDDYSDFLADNAKKSTKGNRTGLNAVRRMRYEENKDVINAQKRAAYAKRNSKSLNRARTIKDAETLRSITKSDIINTTSIEDIKDHFSNLDIEIKGFDKKDLFNVQTVLAGVDDALKLMPEANKMVKVIEYNPKLKVMGKMHDNGLMEIGPLGIKDYGTGAHETSHAFDFIKSTVKKSYSGEIVEKARKQLGLKSNSKEYKELCIKLTGNLIDSKKETEIFAYAVETNISGIENKLSDVIVELIKENQ